MNRPCRDGLLSTTKRIPLSRPISIEKADAFTARAPENDLLTNPATTASPAFAPVSTLHYVRVRQSSTASEAVREEAGLRFHKAMRQFVGFARRTWGATLIAVQ